MDGEFHFNFNLLIFQGFASKNHLEFSSVEMKHKSLSRFSYGTWRNENYCTIWEFPITMWVDK